MPRGYKCDICDKFHVRDVGGMFTLPFTPVTFEGNENDGDTSYAIGRVLERTLTMCEPCSIDLVQQWGRMPSTHPDHPDVVARMEAVDRKAGDV